LSTKESVFFIQVLFVSMLKENGVGVGMYEEATGRKTKL